VNENDQDTVRAYRMFFSSPAGIVVLNDLMKFCKFRVPVTDAKEEGMRQVFLRIINLSELADDQLIELYAGRKMIQPTEPQDE